MQLFQAEKQKLDILPTVPDCYSARVCPDRVGASSVSETLNVQTLEPNPRASAGNQAYPWVPDCGDGTYRNPILYADYSDPDVLRHGDDFWMTASSFNCTPGMPILHSRDLVNWTLVNHALKNVPGDAYKEVQPGCGVWAPSLRFHVGRFWIFFATPDEGLYMTTAADPRELTAAHSPASRSHPSPEIFTGRISSR